MAESAQLLFEEAVELQKEASNFEEVIHLYEQAVVLGHAGAMQQLADFYLNQTELDSGQVDDMCAFAKLLLNLEGTDKEKDEDSKAALPLLQIAIQNYAHVGAMHVLADAYLKWDGIKVENISSVYGLAKWLVRAEATEEEVEQNYEKARQLLDKIFEKMTQVEPHGNKATPEQVRAMHLLADLYLTKSDIEIKDLKAMNRLSQWLILAEGTEEEKKKNDEKADRLSYEVLRFCEDLAKSGKVQGMQMYVDMFLEGFDADMNYNSDELSEIYFKVFTWKKAKVVEYLAKALLTFVGEKQSKNEENIYEHAVKLYGLAAHWGSLYSKEKSLRLFLKDFDLNPKKTCETGELSMICQKVLSWKDVGYIKCLVDELSVRLEKMSKEDIYDYVAPLYIALKGIRGLSKNQELELLKIRIDMCFRDLDACKKEQHNEPKALHAVITTLCQDAFHFKDAGLMCYLADQLRARSIGRPQVIQLYQEASRLGHGGATEILENIQRQSAAKSITGALARQGIFPVPPQPHNQENTTPPRDSNCLPDESDSKQLKK